MYTIKVDGQEIYSPALSDDPLQIISPRLQLEVGTAGSLSFTVPPGHGAHGSIRKRKSLVTMEWDGVEIFRGMAMEEKTDSYNQQEVYCEGILSALLDSVQRPFTFSGTALEYCTQAIATHNTQVEAEKQFTLGDFSALTDETVLNLESDGYSDTLSAIQAVLDGKEGFLRTRYANGVNYLDFVTSYGANGQAIEFGVNLVDFDNQTMAGDICTVMLPIGGMLEDGTTVTIASVNNGSDVIENAEGIAQYGRIVKTYAFDNVTDPAELLKLARAKLDAMTIGQTLTLQAVDMHLIDPEKGIILPGVPVLIHTLPHGVDKEDICTALDLDPENPEKATYTFGEPAKTQSGTAAMIANQLHTHTRTIQTLYKHYTETDYTVQIHAGLLDSMSEYQAQAKIELDGINATLDLMVQKDELISQINMSPESIRISSSMIDLDGYVTMSEMEAKIAEIESGWAEYLYSSQLNADTANIESLSAGDIDAASVEASVMTIGGASVATQDWVAGQEYATQKWVTGTALTPYATEAWVMGKGYLEKDALTTKTASITYVYAVNPSGAVAVRDADGNIIGTAVTGITASTATTEITYVAYA